MTWLLVIGLAVLTFIVAAFVLKLPRAGWALYGAALMLGLAGYALQGSPEQMGSPKVALFDTSGNGAATVDARRALFDPNMLPSRHVVSADGFSRRGQYEDAAGFLRGAVHDDPDDTEAWLALGNALIEHADGQLTPAAMYAYGQAERSDPAHPGAAYFLGVAMIRSGRPGEARGLWQDLVDRAPEDSPFKAELQARVERLDEMILRMGAGQGPMGRAAAPQMPAGAPTGQ